MKNGFTLIELIIAVAIIGIVAALVIPALQGLHSTRLADYNPRTVNARRVEDHPNLDNCKELNDGSRTIYSCPDGKIYTK